MYCYGIYDCHSPTAKIEYSFNLLLNKNKTFHEIQTSISLGGVMLPLNARLAFSSFLKIKKKLYWEKNELISAV